MATMRQYAKKSPEPTAKMQEGKKIAGKYKKIKRGNKHRQVGLRKGKNSRNTGWGDG